MTAQLMVVNAGVYGLPAVVNARPAVTFLLACAFLAAYLVVWAGILIFSKRPRAELFKRFAAISLAFCLIFGTLEAPALFGRVDYRSVFRTPVDLAGSPNDLVDPELLHIHKPHLRLVGSTRLDLAGLYCLEEATVYPYDIKYDKNGFRNDVDLESADVALIGDSFIEGGPVESAELVSSELARLQNCTVANLGILAYGPQQELAVLKRYALPLRPRNIIWAFFDGNDLSDTRNYDEAKKKQARVPEPLRAVWRRSLTNNALLTLLRLIRPCSPPAQPEKMSGLIPDGRGGQVRLYFERQSVEMSEQDIKALERVQSILAEAYRLCKAHNIRFIVAFIPSKNRVYRGVAQFAPDSEVARLPVNDLPQQLRAGLADISPEIEYIDLTEPLSRAAAQGSVVYFPEDTHWNAEGQRVAAGALSEIISAAPAGSNRVR